MPSLHSRYRFSLIWLLVVAFTAVVCTAQAEDPAEWTQASLKEPPTVAETRDLMRRLALFVRDNHLKQTADSPQRGMVYEYFVVARKGEADQFIQGEALDTMHDGAWLAAALATAARATDDPLYHEFLTRWQLPFYCKMLNHSDELFQTEPRHVHPDRAQTWSGAKEWLLQPGEKGFVPYWWDDGNSVSLERVRTKDRLPPFPSYDHYIATEQPNPAFLLHGYSHGSSNHLAQDLGVMLQVSWLLLRTSQNPADQQLAKEVALAARHLHECRMRHHGHIPMCDAPAALAQDDAELMKHVPAADQPGFWQPANHYTKALGDYRPGQRYNSAGFADDQQYRYYAGIARTGGEVPPALAFKTIYDTYTEPLLYRVYSDDAPVPAGVNRFDLHPYFFQDGKPVDYRSDKKGPFGKPRPIGSRMGPQNMIVSGWGIQLLRAQPGIWETRYRRDFADDARIFIVDPPPRSSAPLSAVPATDITLGDVELSLQSTREALRISGRTRQRVCILEFYSQPDAAGKAATITLRQEGESQIVNAAGDPVMAEVKSETRDGELQFQVQIPYTFNKGQREWLNCIEHGRYSIRTGDATRNLYFASPEEQVLARLEYELGGGLRTWDALFRERGYIPTGVNAGANWEEFSDSGAYAHLINAAAQWLYCLEDKRDWEQQQVPEVSGRD